MRWLLASPVRTPCLRWVLATNNDPLTGDKRFKVPAGVAAYRLTASVKRSSKLTSASTRIDATWMFHSNRPSAGQTVQLPASVTRFHASTGLDSRVVAGKKAAFPVTVEGLGEGQGRLPPRQDHRQGEQHVDDLGLQRLLRQVRGAFGSH